MYPSNLMLRNYEQQDFPGVLKLYDQCMVYMPHFARDEGFIRYLVNCSATNGNNVLVTLENEEITGLAIISVTIEEGGLKQGSIAELQAKDTLSMRALMQAALDYCSEKDADMIAVAPPPSSTTDEIFKDWLEVRSGVMLGKLLSPLPLLQALLDTQRIKSYFAGERIIFYMDGEIIEATITPEVVKLTQLDKEPDNPAIFVTLAPEILLKVVLGQINSCIACLTRKIQIRGLKNVPLILRLLQMAKLPEPWYVTLGDRM